MAEQQQNEGALITDDRAFAVAELRTSGGAMSTAVMIRVAIVFVLVIIALAGFNVGRFFDLVVQGWPALAALLGILVGGKTMERVKELVVNRGGA